MPRKIITSVDWLYKDATIYLVRENNIYNLFKEHYNQIKNREISS